MEIQEVSSTGAAFVFLAHKSENNLKGRIVRAVSDPCFCPPTSQPGIRNDAAFVGTRYPKFLAPALHLLPVTSPKPHR